MRNLDPGLNPFPYSPPCTSTSTECTTYILTNWCLTPNGEAASVLGCAKKLVGTLGDARWQPVGPGSPGGGTGGQGSGGTGGQGSGGTGGQGSGGTGGQGSGGTTSERQPLGELLSVDMELAGLQGQPMLLSWSIFQEGGQNQLSRNWLGNFAAYRLEATTNDDSGTLEMWIPLPRQPGPYFVRLTIATTGGVSLASMDSGPFG
jgi:hypothetical protein